MLSLPKHLDRNSNYLLPHARCFGKLSLTVQIFADNKRPYFSSRPWTWAGGEVASTAENASNIL